MYFRMRFPPAKNTLPALRRETLLETRKVLNVLKSHLMPRKKATERDAVLTHNIVIRVTEETFKKLEKIKKESDCKSIAQVVRNILADRHIKYIVKDMSMNGTMEELAMIRKEIKAIGININQQTHRFHISQSDAERSFHFRKTAEIYRSIDPKIDDLLQIVSKLAEKWLQG